MESEILFRLPQMLRTFDTKHLLQYRLFPNIVFLRHAESCTAAFFVFVVPLNVKSLFVIYDVWWLFGKSP